MLVAEGHWSECQNRFARFIHRLDCFLKARRGCGSTKMAVGIYDDCYACWNGCSRNTGDIGSRMYSLRAHAD